MQHVKNRKHLVHGDRHLGVALGALAALLITLLGMAITVAARDVSIPSIEISQSDLLAPNVTPGATANLPRELRWERSSVTFDGMIRDSRQQPSRWIRERR